MVFVNLQTQGCERVGGRLTLRVGSTLSHIKTNPVSLGLQFGGYCLCSECRTAPYTQQNNYKYQVANHSSTDFPHPVLLHIL